MFTYLDKKYPYFILYISNSFLFSMKKYICPPCGYIYDPELGDPDGGIPPGTAFEDIPDTWICPLCGLSKSVFEPYEAE